VLLSWDRDSNLAIGALASQSLRSEKIKHVRGQITEQIGGRIYALDGPSGSGKHIVRSR
jgi:hypothetical protein